MLSRVRLLVTPWTAAHQAPPSMGFSRQEYWSGVSIVLFSYKKEWNTDTWYNMWMNLENILLSESKAQNATFCIIPFIGCVQSTQYKRQDVD